MDKSYELRQQRAKIVDDARVLLERAEKEKRAFTADEDVQHKALCDQAFELAKRISTLDRQAALEGIGPNPEGPPGMLPHEDPANGAHRYSILRAVKCIAEKRPLDGLEAEVSQELAKRSQKSPQGFLIPMCSNRSRLRATVDGRERRALDATTGAGAVPTILSADWIELLRNAMKVKQAGAREILDLVGKFSIPRQNAAATGYWVAESGAPTGSNQTLDQVPFTPHTIGAFTDVSRRFFELSILDSAEEFVKQDLTAVIARGVDLAAINGTGASNQPLGILQNTGITSTRTVALGSAGGAPTWAAMVELYTIVSRGNAADLGEFSYMGNADVEGTLATTVKAGSTFPTYILSENGRVYNRQLFTTQQVPNNLSKSSGSNLSAIIGGVWNQLILAYWSGVDILVDPYTGSSSGTVRIVALQDMDVQARHNEAFSVIVDMISNQTS
jgi:HK97 family phage major capsid protein